MNSKQRNKHTEYSNVKIDDILTESQEGWSQVSGEQSADDSVNRVNSYINKAIDARKIKKIYKKHSYKNSHTALWLIIVFILIFLSFVIILKII